MNNLNHKKIFFNRADVQEAERSCCDNCFEQVVFEMRDKEHEFSIGLTTILECIAFAVSNGDLPKLPRSWCADVENAFNVNFSEDISYYDYEKFKSRRKK